MEDLCAVDIEHKCNAADEDFVTPGKERRDFFQYSDSVLRLQYRSRRVATYAQDVYSDCFAQIVQPYRLLKLTILTWTISIRKMRQASKH